MKKWIAIGGVIIVGIAVLVVVGLSNLGPMIKNVVNSYGPELTKTKISLADVKVSLFSGEAELKDFYLGNPKGFKSESAMKAGLVYVDVDEGSIMEDTIIIDRIEIVQPEITYEKAGGTDNFNAILNNVKKAIGADKGAGGESKETGEGAKKILIRNFIVKGGKVKLAMSLLGGKAITAPLPDIHLKNIGQKKGGSTPEEAFQEIFAELSAKVTSQSVTSVFDLGIKGLEPVKEAGDVAKKGVEVLTGVLGGLLGK